jgi:(1->4)-alpha-D-glucan 1-alpha-D-glucosylmutase
VLAFSRQHGDTVMLVIVPRLCGRLMRGELRLPVGEDVWSDCEIHLPQHFSVPLRNYLTGETHSLVDADRAPRLRISSILSSFPLALLVADAS